MTFAPPPNSQNLPRAYGGCTCECHYTHNVMHFMPCCYPRDDEVAKQAKEISDKYPFKEYDAQVVLKDGQLTIEEK